MMSRDSLVKFVYDYFGKEEIIKAQAKDTHGANGLQLKGQDKVTGVGLGVTLDLELMQKAVASNLNFLICHHGLRLSEVNFVIDEVLKKRLRFAFDHNLTLVGFHYLLDAHKKVGNNAQILKKLGAKIERSFDDDWGWVGKLAKPQQIEEILEKCRKIFKAKPVAFLEGTKKIKRIAVVSGGGKIYPYQPLVAEIRDEIDLYITGEALESTRGLCKEAGINYLSYGHYNTEVFGVQALGMVIKKKLPKLKVEFINIPNKL